MFRVACLTALVAVAAAFAVTPASAARHTHSCYDYAWQSQDQKDCLAHPEKMHAKPMKAHAKHMKKDMHHDMKDMKDMKKDEKKS